MYVGAGYSVSVVMEPNYQTYTNQQLIDTVVILKKQTAHIAEQLKTLQIELERRRALGDELYLAQLEEIRGSRQT